MAELNNFFLFLTHRNLYLICILLKNYNFFTANIITQYLKHFCKNSFENIKNVYKLTKSKVVKKNISMPKTCWNLF